MKILALDTSSSVAAVAIMDNGILLGEYIINHKKTHSQKIMHMIREIMENLELKPEHIDIYAASIGPGSFTGLRIGVTTVKAMAFAVGKPVIGIHTLDALAYNIPVTKSLICPIMDARNNQVYTAVYKMEGNFNNIQSRITDYMGIPVAELADIISDMNCKTVFIGDAVELYIELLKEKLRDRCEFAPGHLLLQRASPIAYMASLKALEGNLESCFDMVPFYLRKSQAEQEYEKRQLPIDKSPLSSVKGRE